MLQLVLDYAIVTGMIRGFRKVWAFVLRKVREKLGRNVSLLRLDGLVWQVGKIMYACNYAKSSSLKEIQRYLAEKRGHRWALSRFMRSA